MPSTATPALTIIRHTATRLRTHGWLYDAASLDLALKALEPRTGDLEARARRLFGREWIEPSVTEAAE